LFYGSNEKQAAKKPLKISGFGRNFLEVQVFSPNSVELHMYGKKSFIGWQVYWREKGVLSLDLPVPLHAQESHFSQLTKMLSSVWLTCGESNTSVVDQEGVITGRQPMRPLLKGTKQSC
jgi:hypothetical protein